MCWALDLILIFKILIMIMKQLYMLISRRMVQMCVALLLICCCNMVLILACSRGWERRRCTCWWWGPAMSWRVAGASRACGIKRRAWILIRGMNRGNQPCIWRSSGIGLCLWNSCLNVAQILMRCGSRRTSRAARGYSPLATGLCTLLAKSAQRKFWV